ncbi:unnamed protein product [Acanthoscelides obtectus]|uniref:isoleucine--tRNA ligase n=1 Tax=Acanthoscelides obtectus TaxID=200917 RepID=A0A9P0L4T7_ACAOB
MKIENMILRKITRIQKTNVVFYSTKPAQQGKLYSNTVFLPKTRFPLRLENNKLLERDEAIHNTADFENLYTWQRSHLSEPEFVLHDGPPYANGQAHMGHAINKILKDTILRCHIISGNKVHYIPGWDCHGLPIELKAISDNKDLDPIQIRKKARHFAEKTIKEQMKAFKSWGVIGDWKNTYQTFNQDYVKTQFRIFHKLYQKNLVYRDIKPIHWSPSSRTALAEAELEYNENHKSPSTYVRFEIKHFPNFDHKDGNRLYAIIWTTTPWTLPANNAVCYNEKLSYVIVKKANSSDSSLYVIAADLLKTVSSVLNCDFEVVKEFKGDMLEGTKYIHPIYSNQECTFVNSSHAVANKGTGLVHSAGSHGPEDFLVSLNYKLPLVDLVDDAGCYNSHAGDKLQGKFVLTEGNQEVQAMLEDNLMHSGEITHSYPYDWRTKQPVIIKASQQWFIDTDALRNRAIELIEQVDIIPKDRSDIYRKNLVSQIQKRPYWCISRQRKWGVPIPVLYDHHSEKIINEHTINHHCNLLRTYGADFWWILSDKELLPDNLHSSYNLENLTRSQDIMDIWFDSGISWARVLEGSKIADMYLEGADQFTGWFQSSLLTSVAMRDKAPYKTIYVHGFAVDENGTKMSKSLGNVVNPVDIMKGSKKQKPYGVDVLRWWVTCHANQDALASVSHTTLQSCTEELQKIRSVLRFALGSLSDYEATKIDYKELLLIDKYMLHLLYKFHIQTSELTRSYQFHRVSAAVLSLLTNSISALYYTSIKDRLYCDHLGSTSRKAAQYTLHNLFEIVTQTIAPMVPHLVEEMYQYYNLKDNKTYFTSTHLKPQSGWENNKIAEIMAVILNCKRDLNKALGPNTTDKDVKITLCTSVFKSLQDFGTINDIEQQVADIVQVAGVTVLKEDFKDDPNRIFTTDISESSRFCCPRCRKVQSDEEDELCKRCTDVVNSSNCV